MKVSPSSQEELYGDCLDNMAKVLEFEISRLSSAMGSKESHVRRLHGILCQLCAEASDGLVQKPDQKI